jgi:hypothetical protein
MSTLHIIHTVAALIVLAEAINKLERCDPCARGMTLHERLVDSLKAVAWFLLAFGAGVALLGLLLFYLGIHVAAIDAMRLGPPDLSDTAVMAGFAVLIFRTRVKEG